MRQPSRHPVDVLVVGAGPAGLATAVSALRHGARVLVVERRATTSTIPRATGLSTRTMEILRTWGLEAAVRAGAVDCEPLVATGPSLAGETDRRPIRSYPTAAEAIAVSPTVPAIVPQDHLEPVLVDEARRLRGRVDFSTALDELQVRPGGVHARLGDGSTVRARHVVGADGPRSSVRTALGITTQELGSLGDFVQALFRAPIAERLGRRAPALAFVGSADDPVVLLPAGDGRWALAIRTTENPDPATWVRLIREAAGIPDLPVELLGALPFQMTAAVADRLRRGPGVIAGDAAHRTTPAGGTGLNTALHDGHELGWKLAWIAQGLAGEALLDAHDAERGPVGRAVALRSLRLDDGDPADGVPGDLGRTYRSPVIVTPDGENDAAPPLRSDRAARPGERAPHVWLGRAGRRRMSVLDVLADRLTLVTGPDADGWARAVERRERRSLARTWTSAGALPAVAQRPPAHLDRLAADRDSTGRVAAAYRLGPGSAVLVRPDGIVAWRHDGPCADYDATLAPALDTVLGWATATAAATAS